MTHAIGQGADVALQIDNFLAGFTLEPIVHPEVIPVSCLSCGTCRDCSMCLEACPEGAIRRIEKADGSFEYVSDDHLCIGCGICAGICPCGIWAMDVMG